MDSTLLLSGSDDQSARVWHVQSRQCLRVVNHKGLFDRHPGIFRQRSHYPREMEKHSFISTVRPTVHTNPSRKWSFSKTLFKLIVSGGFDVFSE